MGVIRGLLHMMFGVLDLLFLVRALLSWFQDGDNDVLTNIYEVVFNLTEPLILPMRRLLDRYSWVHQVPIDLAFLFTFVLISLVGSMV